WSSGASGGGPFTGDPDRGTERPHRPPGCEPDALRSRGNIGEHQIRAGQHAQRIEMVLADPRRVHAELVGIERLLRDVGDELVCRPRVVLVVIVAEGKIAEFHSAPPSVGWGRMALVWLRIS